jgi:starch phosphorylase
MSKKTAAHQGGGTTTVAKPPARRAPAATGGPSLTKLLAYYGCGPESGSGDALYERHLTFDDVVAVADAGPRERYQAVARSVRDVLSQRWIHTEKTYDRLDPKRVYYLSMEFLIGRSLSNNITNLLLDPHVAREVMEKEVDWVGILEQEPDAGLGNGGLGRLAACFLDSMATLQLPAMGYGLRYEHGMFRQSIRNGWQEERPDNWLRRQDPWEVPRPNDQGRLPVLVRDPRWGPRHRQGALPAGQVPDRPVVSYGERPSTPSALGRATRTLRFQHQPG